MEKENKLIPISTNNVVQKVSTSIAITNKLITENNKQLVREILHRNPELFIDLISEFYNLELKLMKINENVWNWQKISINKTINKNLELIEEYQELIDWTLLIRNIEHKIDRSFIEQYIGKINLYDISSNSLLFDYNLIKIGEKNGIKYDWLDLFSKKNDKMSLIIDKNKKNHFNKSKKYFLFYEQLKSITILDNAFDNYENQVDWQFISGLKNVNWSKTLIDKYIEYWDWNILSSNSSIPINDIFENYKNHLSYFHLTSNKSFNLSIDFIKNNEDKELNWFSISENTYLNWDLESIEHYKEKIKWFYFSSNFKFTNEMIVKFEKHINFKQLSHNKNIFFDYEIIKENENKLDFQYLSSCKNVSWSEKLINDFSDKWNWDALSNNENIKWTFDLIKKYDNKLSFDFNNKHSDYEVGVQFGHSVYGLSSNKNTVFSEELIEKYKDKWDWNKLSYNKNLPWSEKLIEKHQDKWDWGNLSRNQNLPYTLQLINKYKDNWTWDFSGLSANESLPWSIELVHKYLDNWDFYYLSNNNGIPWSVKLIHTFSEKLESSENIWNTLKPYIDDEMVIELLEEIKTGEIKI